MKKSCLILAFSVLFSFMYIINVFAYREEWNINEDKRDSNSCSFRNVSLFYSTTLTPSVNSINFSQDDVYYYFDYDIDYISNDIKRISYADTTPGTDNIFVTQYQDTWPSFDHSWSATFGGDTSCSNNEKTSGSISFGSYKFTYSLYRIQNYNNLSYLVDDWYANYNVSSKISIPVAGLKTDYYYNSQDCLHNYFYIVKTAKENGLEIGTANVSSSATSLSNDYWQYNYKGTVKIEKTEFLKYRYLTFLATDALINMKYEENKTGVITGHWDKYDLKGYSIDLEQYRNCTHEWQTVNAGDKMYHEQLCSKCKWSKKEVHNLLYEYDGIDNNECVCGYHNIINIEIDINDDNRDTISKRISSYGEISTISVPKKTGNNFEYYTLYEKHKINKSTYSEIYIGTRSDIDMYAGNYSMKYYSVYTPNHYTFHFSTVSNIDVQFKEKLDDQVFKYGIGQVVKNAEHILGKCFLGWSLNKGSNNVDINSGQIIKEYTTIDGAEYTLYPVYEKMSYYVRYNTDEGVYANKQSTYLVKYNYEDNCSLEYPFEDGKMLNVAYYNYNNKKIKKLSDIKDFVIFKDTIIDLYAVVSHNTGGGSGGGGGSASDTSSSFGPSGSNSSQEIGSEVGPGTNIQNEADIGEKNEPGFPDENVNELNNGETQKQLDNVDATKKENLLYKKKESENLNIESKSENYEKLMDYLRKKYEKEKLEKEAKVLNIENDDNKQLISQTEPKFLQILTKRYGGAILTIITILVSALCTFIPGKFS